MMYFGLSAIPKTIFLCNKVLNYNYFYSMNYVLDHKDHTKQENKPAITQCLLL